MSRQAAWAMASVLVVACTSDPKSRTGPGPRQRSELSGPGALVPAKLTAEQLKLRDPETCKGCHPAHYREWSGSMHAYAAKDPVFLAMNRRGQRETNGELGDFCINCHAPMAVRDGLTKDGLNIEQLPDFERGVSCFFCHNVTSIDGDHNGKLSIANDTTMRGPFRDPIPSSAHGSAYSILLDDETPNSSAMCGACHDVVTPAGVQLERLFKEYKHGIFSKSPPDSRLPFDTCTSCHMAPKSGVAAEVAGAPERLLHEHFWPGVDVPLTEFPHSAALRSAVEECDLSRSVQFFNLEVTPPDLFTFQIETGAGHNQPSGAAQDRRMWLEFLAYDESGRLLESVSSGNIADGEIEEHPVGDPKHDPNLLMLRDRIYDAEGNPVHMFWDARKSAAYPEGHSSTVLPVATTTYVEGENAVVKQYRALGPDGKLPARVTARLRMRPIGLDTLQDLVDSGDLDPSYLAKMPTFTLGAQIEWTRADGLFKTIPSKLTSDCDSYRCMLDPGSEDCVRTDDTE